MANTDAYLLLGLVVIAGVMGSYVLSLVLRMHNAHQVTKTLESLASEQK